MDQPNTVEAWEAEERRRELETEAWKVAQLATTLAAGEETGSPGKIFGPEDGSRHVENARWILAESRRQVAAERGITP